MSVNLTSILQNIQTKFAAWVGLSASRQVGVVLEDTASVTWTYDGFGNIQAVATPQQSVTLLSEQTVGNVPSVTIAIPSGYKYYELIYTAASTTVTDALVQAVFNGDSTAGDYYQSGTTQAIAGSPTSFGSFTAGSAIVGGYVAGRATIYVSAATFVNAVGVGGGTNGSVVAMSYWVGAGQPATSMVLTLSSAVNFASGTFSLYGYK